MALQNLSPNTIRSLMSELRTLTKKPLEGVQVIASEDISRIEAVIEGPADTPFVGGRFRVRLTLGEDYPGSAPKGHFLTHIFHPNVGPDGAICVNTLKRDWKPDLGISHVLLTIKCLLIVPNPESSLNEEAGRLLLEHYDDYAKRAALMTQIHAQGPPGAPKKKKKVDRKKKKRSNLKRL